MTGEALPDPWHSFREDAVSAIKSINVSHRPRRRIAGELHKATILGATPDPSIMVRRKHVIDLDQVKQLEKVRDPTIRDLLKSHLKAKGVAVETNSKISKENWTPLPTMPSGTPIRKVRMLERGEGYREIREGSWAELGSNHHMELCDVITANGTAVVNRDGSPKRVGALVSMLDAAARVRDGKPIIEREHGLLQRFVMSVSINEMFLLEVEPGQLRLHRVQKMSPGSIILRPHTYAGKVSDTDKPPLIQRRTENTLRGRKVTVDPLGRIRWAND